MKLDPNTACVIFKEDLLWAMIHDLIAHPVMAITFYCKLSIKFHNYTSCKAWKR
jgi:hypothetical protein